jgi:hypothetical protein
MTADPENKLIRRILRKSLHLKARHVSSKASKQRLSHGYSWATRAFSSAYGAVSCHFRILHLTKNSRNVTFYNKKLKDTRYLLRNRAEPLKNTHMPAILYCTMREE